MPRLVHRNPKYSKHRASGQAVVTIDGRTFTSARTARARVATSTTASSRSGSPTAAVRPTATPASR